MTQPEGNDPNPPAAPENADASSEASAPPTAEAPAPSAPAPMVAETSAPNPEAAQGDGDAEGDSEGGEGDEGASEGGDAAAAQPGAPEGERPKKKRRRRRKKKPGAPGEGATAEGGAPAEGASASASASEGGPPREKQPKRERPRREGPPRERPAFNVGDVVFGKVIEFTEDALFVDLSGKAKAIFDLRELLITDEDVEEYTKADKKEAEEIAAARAASMGRPQPAAQPVPTEGEGAGTPEGLPEGTPPAETEDAAADASSVDTQPEPVVAEAAPPAEEAAPAADEGAPAAADETASAGAAAEGGAEAKLPRVVLEPGAPFVGLVHNDGGRGGLVVLTHHPKRAQKVKPILADASKTGKLVFGLVTGTIKGGVEVDVDGLRAFAPASHVELRPGANLSHLVGQRLAFAVTQYAKRGRDVVLSRRAMLETEAKERREEALKKIEIGATIDGTVRTVVPFGAFVDIGGIEGLVPLSEMSHNRADQPKDVFKVGETCRVKILRVDEKGKLWLSRKAAIEDPWGSVAQKYAPGTKHQGKVARIQPFGAFIELEPGIDGLIHTADLSIKRIESPDEVVKVGQDIEVVVANVDSRQHRIALHPAPSGDMANEAPQKVQMHKTVKVVVVTVENTGLIVRVLGATGRQARGYISASATGTPRGTELRKLFPVGKELDAKIIDIDPRRGEAKLSIKALNEETERNAYQQYRAQVKREAKFGTFADLLAKRNITPNK